MVEESIAKVESLSAPGVLTEGQNLYDQPPFESILEGVSQAHSHPIVETRHNLSVTVRQYFSIKPDGDWNDLSSLMSKGYLRYEIPGFRRGDPNFLSIEAVKDLGQEFSLWIFWAEYIFRNLSSLSHANTGQPINQAHLPFEVDSYRSWVIKKAKKQQSIEELKSTNQILKAFPQSTRLK